MQKQRLSFRMKLFIGLMALVMGIGAGVWQWKRDSSGSSSHGANILLSRECPDEWIEDRMPGAEGDKTERQYFIFKGERKEIKDYDMGWIESNCSVRVQYVY